MTQKLIGMFTGMITGYLVGMFIGFTLFDPNLDIWALLGFVLALVGIGVGLLPSFRRNTRVVLSGLIGLYLGLLLGILVFGNAKQDDLFHVLQARSWGLLLSLLGALLGGVIGARWLTEKLTLILFCFVFLGFLGGYLFGIALKLAPFQSLVGWSPFVIGSGLAGAVLVWLVQRRLTNPHRALKGTP